MKTNSLLCLISASLLTGSALAGTMGPAPAEWAWVGTLSVGPIWEDGGRTQTFFLEPEWERTYTADKSSKSLAKGELFVGLQKSISQQIKGQLGLAVAATTKANLSGSIWDDADPLFDNFFYSYKLQHSHVAVKGKLLADMNYWLIPWISGSVGVGFNDAHSFKNRPKIFEAIATPNFSSHTKTSFTYAVGAGVQKALSANWQVGAGYEFADWGKSLLHRMAGQTLGQGLALNHLYTNGVLFNLTYVA
jgi:opacity protein-like surface antigen